MESESSESSESGLSDSSLDTESDIEEYMKPELNKLERKHSYRVQVFVDITEPNNPGLKLSSVNGARNEGHDYCPTYTKLEGIVITEKNTNYRMIRLFEVQFSEKLPLSSSSTTAAEKFEYLLSRVINYKHRRWEKKHGSDKVNKYLKLSRRSLNTENSKFYKVWGGEKDFNIALRLVWREDIFTVSDNLKQLFKDFEISCINFHQIKRCTRKKISKFVNRSENVDEVKRPHVKKSCTIQM